MVKKTLSLLMSTILVLAIFTACGDSSQSQGTSNNGSSVPASSQATGETDGGQPSGSIVWLCNDYKEMPQKTVDEYNATHNANLEVKVEIYPRAQLMEVIEIKLGAGDSDFDVLFVDSPLVSAYTYRDYLEPLTPYFTQEELDSFADADRAATTIDGEFMAAPFMSSSQVLLVNKTLLEEAGVTFPEKYYDLNNRITWEELMEVAIEFQQSIDPDHTKGLWGFTLDQMDNVYQVLALPNSLGAKGIADDGYTVEGVLNIPEWEKAMQLYQNFYIEYGISPNGLTNDEIRETYNTGKIALYVTNTVRAKEVDFEVGYGLHPYFAEGQPATPTGSWTLGINKNTNNLEQAIDFVKWCTVGEGAEFWMINNNQLPARKDLLEKMESGEYPGFETYPLVVSKVGISEALNGAAYPRPRSPGFLEFDTAMSTMFQDIRSGADVATALESTAQQLHSSFQKYRD